MSKLAVHFSSRSSDWETPQDFFDELDKEFNFTLDPCASHTNAKCDKYFTKEDNGLLQDWSGETVFMNPPYGREIKDWVRKAYEESLKGTTVVCLLPARTDTRWFHDYIYGNAAIRFIKGRLKFGGAKNSAPFPSMVVIYDRGK
ncbi:adenine methyltransferase [Pueribacillus theae]|uniref:Adenine methyltransferase n=1 Tax=Pueribacillus theae TaxID=2171751 RepID=A0A2U1K296_9BACI|nr:DNA N-6-adenine-methyltransferase [Pueribacillus theae]PWA11088.1 adenine methyltransferase [Pueribacillus theae]